MSNQVVAGGRHLLSSQNLVGIIQFLRRFFFSPIDCVIVLCRGHMNHTCKMLANL